MLEKGLILNNTYQDFPGLCTMYPSEYFCPKDHRTGLVKCTDKTVCIHHFAGSWIKQTLSLRIRHGLKCTLVRFFGERTGVMIADVLSGRILKK